MQHINHRGVFQKSENACHKNARGMVLLATVILLSVLSFWAILGIEIAQISWHATKNHWAQRQVQQLILQSFVQAKEQLESDDVPCLLDLVVELSDIKHYPKSWWHQNGCVGKLGNYEYYYVVSLLYQSEAKIAYQVSAYAHIGLLQQFAQADFMKQHGAFARLNYR